MNLDPDHPGSKEAGMSGCMKGCLVVIVIMVLGSIFLVMNIRNFGARAVAYIIKSTIEKSDLHPTQKLALIVRVDKLRKDYTDGLITDEQLKRIGEEVFTGPLMPVGTMLFIESEHLNPSGLSEEEKTQARTTLKRLARGVIEKKISYAKLDPMFAAISRTEADGQRKLKKNLTDKEMRDFLTLAQREVDKEGISSEPLEIDLGKEFDEAVKRAMQEPVEMPF